jgi:hypothetical protein
VLDLEQLVGLEVQQRPGTRLPVEVTRHRVPCPGVSHHAHGLAVGASEERVRVLAPVAVHEVALAERAAGQHLDRVDAAHVRLDDGDDLLVGGVGTDLAQGDAGGLHTHRQAGAQVPVEGRAPLEHLGGHLGAGRHASSFGRGAKA